MVSALGGVCFAGMSPASMRHPDMVTGSVQCRRPQRKSRHEVRPTSCWLHRVPLCPRASAVPRSPQSSTTQRAGSCEWGLHGVSTKNLQLWPPMQHHWHSFSRAGACRRQWVDAMESSWQHLGCVTVSALGDSLPLCLRTASLLHISQLRLIIQRLACADRPSLVFGLPLLQVQLWHRALTCAL